MDEPEPSTAARAQIQHAKLIGAKVLLHIYNADGDVDLEDLAQVAGGSLNLVLFGMIAHSMTLTELKAAEVELPVDLYLTLLVDRLENGAD